MEISTNICKQLLGFQTEETWGSLDPKKTYHQQTNPNLRVFGRLRVQFQSISVVSWDEFSHEIGGKMRMANGPRTNQPTLRSLLVASRRASEPDVKGGGNIIQLLGNESSVDSRKKNPCIYTPKNSHGTWKWWFPIGISFSKGPFSGSMFVFGGVIILTVIDKYQ